MCVGVVFLLSFYMFTFVFLVFMFLFPYLVLFECVPLSTSISFSLLSASVFLVVSFFLYRS